MDDINLVDTDLANLNIADEEDEPMLILDLCFVGRVLTDSVVHFPALKNTLADLWHPLRGVTITELENKRILFRFYSEVDMERVIDGIPWFFNRHLIILHRLTSGDEPNAVPLWETIFWVQVHNIPIGFFTEGMVKQIGDFIGKFVEYDTSMVIRGIVQFMRIKVLIDTRYPLRRKKRLGIGQNRFIYVLFQYERLSLFCFLCGRLGHGESFCPVRLTLSSQQVEFGWDISLRAISRRGGYTSRWLREESGAERWRETEAAGERRRVHNDRGHMNNSEHRRELWSRGPRQYRNFMEERGGGILDFDKEDGNEMEDLLMGFVDGKKRQRVSTDGENSGERRSMLEFENEISAANCTLADRTQ
ncbi:nucleolin-like [Gossypium australe]|uniref:Nucleolin-like n=1 Tax=Gossypium australe TaxID=47621 RepID=A0A5B6UQX0_9ROSI|nr:nucleolin-like [Gossypium australe]